MGKLTDMVAEPVSLPDRLKISAKRVRLASIGLFSKVDAERTRLYRQIMELGDGYGKDDTLVGQLTRIGTGTVSLVLEESQRVFDELVEAGEQALAGDTPKPVMTSKLTTPRPVAKVSAPKLVATTDAKPAKPAARSTAPRAAVKPALKPVENKALASQPETAVPAQELRQKFDDAKARLMTLTSPPDQLTMLTLYALFKQATEGDVTGRRPGPTKLVERAKFDERQKIKGMTLVEAMERYIATVDRLLSA
jgi:acyl-CoA-binding protein